MLINIDFIITKPRKKTLFACKLISKTSPKTGVFAKCGAIRLLDITSVDVCKCLYHVISMKKDID